MMVDEKWISSQPQVSHNGQEHSIIRLNAVSCRVGVIFVYFAEHFSDGINRRRQEC